MAGPWSSLDREARLLLKEAGQSTGSGPRIYSRANSLRSESIADSDNGEQACGLCHDPVEDAVLDDFQTSTKIDALGWGLGEYMREEIRFMVERDGSAKGIVFSQFTSFLDLIMYSLQKSGITCVLLDGSMTIPARDNVIKRFHEDPDCRIFLISLKGGGVALNLTVASHVFRDIVQQLCRQMFGTLHSYHLTVVLLYITLNFRCT
ncbi:hypothetical protein Cgig2_013305 [Carnegiea gigantea]|uniref:Helicase C-terminal domain-containing protein n=1 Tax=Carnegiea gigantea TaxID=171969 RepID=A0A9Q1H0P8_9CARY|nr:hypothetical protein Cgig2_013305 [Carnegiea gigantea]